MDPRPPLAPAADGTSGRGAQQPAAGLASPPKAGPPSEGATGGGAASSGGGGSGKRGGGGGGQDFERRSDFERQVTTIRQQVERVRANLAKAEQILDDHDRAAGGVVDATPGAGRPAGVN